MDFYIEDEIKIKEINTLELLQSKSDASYKWINIWNSEYLLKSNISSFKILNELIGEKLARVIYLKSSENLLVKINDELIYLYNLPYVRIGESKYALISKNFKDRKKFYYTPEDLIGNNIKKNYSYNINLLEKKCLDNNNFNELKKDLFKLFLLDFFMGQWDRKYAGNILLDKDKRTKSYLSLSPIFDYSGSFNFSFIDSTIENNKYLIDIYDYNENKSENFMKMNKLTNYFGKVIVPSEEFFKILYEFDDNILTMKKYIDLNLNEFFKDFEEETGVGINYYQLPKYIYFGEQKQDILRKTLNK